MKQTSSGLHCFTCRSSWCTSSLTPSRSTHSTGSLWLEKNGQTRSFLPSETRWQFSCSLLRSTPTSHPRATRLMASVASSASGFSGHRDSCGGGYCFAQALTRDQQPLHRWLHSGYLGDNHVSVQHSDRHLLNPPVGRNSRSAKTHGPSVCVGAVSFFICLAVLVYRAKENKIPWSPFVVPGYVSRATSLWGWCDYKVQCRPEDRC